MMDWPLHRSLNSATIQSINQSIACRTMNAKNNIRIIHVYRRLITLWQAPRCLHKTLVCAVPPAVDSSASRTAPSRDAVTIKESLLDGMNLFWWKQRSLTIYTRLKSSLERSNRKTLANEKPERHSLYVRSRRSIWASSCSSPTNRCSCRRNRSQSSCPKD